MIGRRKLLAVLATAGAIFVAMALGSIQTALADDCTVTLTLVSGQVLVFHVNVAPGTPISAMGLPITGPVASESEQCTPTSTTTPAVAVTTSTTTTTATPTTSSSTPTSSSTTSKPTTSTST